MRIVEPVAAVLLSAALAACSGIQFSNQDNGRSHPYRVAAPALRVITDPDCKMTAEVISIPGRFNYLSFKTGLGKIDNTVEFEPGGTIKKIVAKQEGVVDDAVKLLTTVTGAVRPLNLAQGGGCHSSVRVYAIQMDSNGNPFVNHKHPLLNLQAERR